MLSIDLWGKKRLAYLIEKQKFGTYVKLQFSGQGDCVKKIEMSLEHNSNVLSYFALGLPAYVLIKVLIVCFIAREDTKTPLYISIVSVIMNIILSVILISTMREMGIALETAISAWINAILLYIILKTKNNIIVDSRLIINSYKIIISLFVFCIICYLINIMLFSNIRNRFPR